MVEPLPYPKRMFDESPDNTMALIRAYVTLGPIPMKTGKRLRALLDDLSAEQRNEVILTYLTFLITR